MKRCFRGEKKEVGNVFDFAKSLASGRSTLETHLESQNLPVCSGFYEAVAF